MPLAARELRRSRLQPLAQPDRRERVGRLRSARACGDAGVQEPVRDVLEQRRVLGEEELLEDETDLGRPQRGDLTIRESGDVVSGDEGTAGRRPLERAHQV